MASSANAKQLGGSASFALTKADSLKPLAVGKRKIDQIESEFIYRVVKTFAERVREIEALTEIIWKDKYIWTIRNIEVRDAIFRHQALLKKHRKAQQAAADPIAAAAMFAAAWQQGKQPAALVDTVEWRRLISESVKNLFRLFEYAGFSLVQHTSPENQFVGSYRERRPSLLSSSGFFQEVDQKRRQSEVQAKRRMSLLPPTISQEDMSGDFSNINDLKEQLQQLCESAQEKLVTKASEDMRKKKLMCSVMEKTRNQQTVVCGLQLSVNTQRADLVRACDQKDDEITLLKYQLTQLVNHTNDENNAVISGCAKEVFATQRSLESKRAKALDELQALRLRLAAQRKEHFAAEALLRSKKFKMRQETGNWILKYDEEMLMRQGEIETLAELKEEHLAEIDQLSKHFVVVEKQYDDIMAEREAIRVENERITQENIYMARAATRIQAVIRGIQTRRMLKESKSKKGKKGKGKKGKK